MPGDGDSLTLTISEGDVDRIKRALEQRAIREEANCSYDEAEPYVKTRERINQQSRDQCP